MNLIHLIIVGGGFRLASSRLSGKILDLFKLCAPLLSNTAKMTLQYVEF